MTDKNSSSAMARKNLDRRLAPVRHVELPQRPAKGWVRAIRDALGMTSRQLAARLDVAQPTISNIEKNEAADTITLARLREAAEALDCKLVYALVPKTSLQNIIEERAHEVASRQLEVLNHTMRLEDQELTQVDQATERQRLVQRLLAGNPRHLWEAR